MRILAPSSKPIQLDGQSYQVCLNKLQNFETKPGTHHAGEYTSPILPLASLPLTTCKGRLHPHHPSPLPPTPRRHHPKRLRRRPPHQHLPLLPRLDPRGAARLVHHRQVPQPQPAQRDPTEAVTGASSPPSSCPESQSIDSGEESRWVRTPWPTGVWKWVCATGSTSSVLVRRHVWAADGVCSGEEVLIKGGVL